MIVNDVGDLQRCIDTVDGSGYYHCGFIGYMIYIVKFGYGAQFTLCHVDAYSETNLMLTSPTILSTTNIQSLPTANLLRTHPIGYTQLATGENYSTA